MSTCYWLHTSIRSSLIDHMSNLSRCVHQLIMIEYHYFYLLGVDICCKSRLACSLIDL
nr:hypothetical protein Q903MT_gene4864 [Picea sitchensis]